MPPSSPHKMKKTKKIQQSPIFSISPLAVDTNTVAVAVSAAKSIHDSYSQSVSRECHMISRVRFFPLLHNTVFSSFRTRCAFISSSLVCREKEFRSLSLSRGKLKIPCRQFALFSALNNWLLLKQREIVVFPSLHSLSRSLCCLCDIILAVHVIENIIRINRNLNSSGREVKSCPQNSEKLANYKLV